MGQNKLKKKKQNQQQKSKKKKKKKEMEKKITCSCCGAPVGCDIYFLLLISDCFCLCRKSICAYERARARPSVCVSVYVHNRMKPNGIESTSEALIVGVDVSKMKRKTTKQNNNNNSSNSNSGKIIHLNDK